MEEGIVYWRNISKLEKGNIINGGGKILSFFSVISVLLFLFVKYVY